MSTATLEAPSMASTLSANNFGVSPALRAAANNVGGSNLPDRVFLLSLRLKMLGQSKKAPVSLITTDAEPARVRLGKKIFDCPEIDAIRQHHQYIRRYVESKMIPTGEQFRAGMFLMPYTLLDSIEAFFEAANNSLNDLIDDFIAVYDDRIEDDREALASLFDANNYPSIAAARDAFVLEYEYVTLATPEGLKQFDRAVYEREAAKLQKRVEEAAEESRILIMEQAKDLAQSVCERLASDGSGKPKIFRDSLIGNWREFLETFSAKNITDDTQLAALMAEIKTKIGDRDPDEIRKSANVREEIRQHFEGVVAQLDGMIVAKPIRKIDLSELEAE